jgi:SAM-dependent methyltransferase
MTDTSSPQARHDDYRRSHLFKGGSYDQQLAKDPFDAFISWREDEVLRSLIPELFPSGIPRYLDFACGTGRALQVVSQFAKEAYGVDISETMVSQARSKVPNATLVVTDLTTDERDLGTFDLITAFRFLGNAEDSLRDAAMSALMRRLKPNGLFVFDSHRNPWALRVRFRQGKREEMDLHPAKLDALLRRHGLELVSAHGIGWWVVLDRQCSHRLLSSSLAKFMEAIPVGRTPLWKYAPDAIIVARRIAR